MPYRRYFDFSGRSRRLEYWWFSLFWFVLLVGLGIAAVATIAGSLGGLAQGVPIAWERVGGGLWMLLALVAVFLLGSLIPMVALQVRRLHDLGVSGWWYLVYFIVGNGIGEVPEVGTYVSGLIGLGWIVWMFVPGTRGPNRYGDDPKDPAANAEVFA